MSISRESVKAPSSYGEWLECLESLKNGNAHNSGVYYAVINGSFEGSEATMAALQRQIIEAVNALLDKSAKRFVRRMNEAITFNELTRLDLLFIRLKKDINVSLFFEKLDFLPETFRDGLSASVRKQMDKFWQDTTGFLFEQSAENLNSDLEDAIFLIKRIKLFD